MKPIVGLGSSVCRSENEFVKWQTVILDATDMGYPNHHFRTTAFWVAMLYAFLVHCQLSMHVGAYASDMGLHLGFVLDPASNEAAGYSLFHTVSGLLAQLFPASTDFRISVVAGVMMMVLAGALYHSLVLVYDDWSRRYPEVNSWRLSGLVLSVFLVSMIVLLPLIGSFYVGVFTGNPWHNPTYLYARWFTIIAFIWFLRTSDPEKGRDNASWLNLLVFTTAMGLSIWAKPSFMLTLGPAFGVALLIWAIRGQLAWGIVFRVTMALLVALAVLLIIRHRIYADPQVTNAVVLRPGLVWGQYTPSYVQSLLLAASFPAFVTLLRWRKLSPALLVATINWVFATAAFYLLAEEGPRALHANFAWCYMGGLFFWFLAAIGEWFLKPSTEAKWLRWAGCLLFAAHLISGIRYWLIILRGGGYM